MNGKDYRGLKNEGMGLGMIKGWVGKIRGDWGMSRKD